MTDHPWAPEETARLRALIEKPRTVRWWGQNYTITPRLAPTVLGDGKKLLALWPIMLRPNYFVIRIDSHTDTAFGEDWLDEVYAALEDDFGRYDSSEHECQSFPDAVDFGDGSAWEERDWPAGMEPSSQSTYERQIRAELRHGGLTKRQLATEMMHVGGDSFEAALRRMLRRGDVILSDRDEGWPRRYHLRDEEP